MKHVVRTFKIGRNAEVWGLHYVYHRHETQKGKGVFRPCSTGSSKEIGYSYPRYKTYKRVHSSKPNRSLTFTFITFRATMPRIWGVDIVLRSLALPLSALFEDNRIETTSFATQIKQILFILGYFFHCCCFGKNWDKGRHILQIYGWQDQRKTGRS